LTEKFNVRYSKKANLPLYLALRREGVENTERRKKASDISPTGKIAFLIFYCTEVC
jgi:hypothetical protein